MRLLLCMVLFLSVATKLASSLYSRPASRVVAATHVFGPRLRVKHMSAMSNNNEVDAAAIAASTDPAINPAAPTFFDKLVKKEIPATILHEDDLCMAFADINPQGPVHFLVIPKNKDGLNRLSNAREDQKGLLVRAWPTTSHSPVVRVPHMRSFPHLHRRATCCTRRRPSRGPKAWCPAASARSSTTAPTVRRACTTCTSTSLGAASSAGRRGESWVCFPFLIPSVLNCF